MKQTTVNVRVDEDVKKGMEAFCNSVGMNISTAVNIFFKKVLSQGRIPFEVSQPVPRPKSLEEMTKEELYASLEEAMNSEGQPIEEVFAELREEFGFEKI